MNNFLTPQQALQKIKHYCSYQERSHHEVKEKLYAYKLKKHDVDLLITQLIEEDYLNETRFAVQFAGGKFRLKKWGKVKIEYELKLKKVSSYNIKKALAAIDITAYEQVLQTLCKKKWTELKNEQYMIREQKTKNYLLQKGYEPTLIANAIKTLKTTQ